MGALSSADRSTGSSVPVVELTVRDRANGARGRSLCARCPFVSRAALTGDRR